MIYCAEAPNEIIILLAKGIFPQRNKSCGVRPCFVIINILRVSGENLKLETSLGEKIRLKLSGTKVYVVSYFPSAGNNVMLRRCP